MDKCEVPTVIEDKNCLPLYASKEAAGADVRAYIEKPLIMYPKERTLIRTGVRFAVPKGFEMQIRPRSGLALMHGITVLNAPGTLDSDYRGELKVILVHYGDKPFTITPQMRIAQIVLAPVCRGIFALQKELTTTKRGESGFGNTGTH